MRVRLLSLIIQATFSQVNPVEEGEKSVQQLTKDNFEEIVNKGKTRGWLVTFSTPSCGHCVRFKPTFQKLAFDKKETNVNFGNVNCSTNHDLCAIMRVHAYPTILFFKDEKFYKFEGERSEKNIWDFANVGYKNNAGQNIHTAPPSFLENAFNTLEIVSKEIKGIYQSNSMVLKGLVSVFLLIFAFMILSIIGLCFSIFCSRKQKSKED